MSLTATLCQRNWIKGLGHAVVAIAVCSLLAACSSTSRSTTTVVDRNAQQKPTVTSGQYMVRPGDTLYSIAFRYGWDWKALAARNNISAPYTIRPGQAIRFDEVPVRVGCHGKAWWHFNAARPEIGHHFTERSILSADARHIGAPQFLVPDNVLIVHVLLLCGGQIPICRQT